MIGLERWTQVKQLREKLNGKAKMEPKFWSYAGAEAILNLRALLLSQDDRLSAYWSRRPAYLKVPA